MKRIVALVLSILTVLSLLPMGALAEGTEPTLPEAEQTAASEAKETDGEGEATALSEEEPATPTEEPGALAEETPSDGENALTGTEEPSGAAAEENGSLETEETVSAENETASGEEETETVSVTFVSEQTADFSALTVLNAAGETVAPLTDESTKQPVYGSYLLTPGEYTYSISVDGFEPIVNRAFTVNAGVNGQTVTVALTAVTEPAEEIAPEEPEILNDGSEEPAEETAPATAADENTEEAYLEDEDPGELPLLGLGGATEPGGICGDDGDNLTWILDGDGVLTVSGDGDMRDYGSGEAPWYENYRGQIKSVALEAGVTSVGEYAFYGCDKLTAVQFSGNVTTVGKMAFSGCNALVSISCAVDNPVFAAKGNCLLQGTELVLGCSASDIPTTVTTVGAYAFAGCAGLKKINLPANVTAIEKDAFSGCSSLSLIYLPAGMTSINAYAFTNVTAKVCYEEGMAETLIDKDYGGSLTWTADGAADSGTCGDNLTWSLNSMGVLTVTGDGDMTEWTSADETPWYALTEEITSVTVGDGVNNIGSYAFCGCDQMTGVTVGASVSVIGENAFYGCSSLKKAAYTGTDWDSILICDGNSILISVGPTAAHPIDSITLYNEAGEDITEAVIDVDFEKTKTVTLSYVTDPVTEDKVELTTGDASVATVTDAGKITFKKAGVVTVAATAKDSNRATATVTYSVFNGSSLLKLDKSVLMMNGGETETLTATVNPSDYDYKLKWASSDESVVTVSGSGEIEAQELSVGDTAYVYASITVNDVTYTAACRVDVAAKELPIEEQVQRIDLLTASAQVSVYSENYTQLSVLPIIYQNLVPVLDEQDAGTGVVIEKAEFFIKTSDKDTAKTYDGEILAKYFTLNVVDGRTLEIVPNNLAVTAALSGSRELKSSMKCMLALTLRGSDKVYIPEQVLTVSVKKTLPSVKVNSVAFNSFAKDRVFPLNFTGGTVTAILPDKIPSWMKFEQDEETKKWTVALDEDNVPTKYPSSGKLLMSCAVEGWRVPATVTMSYTVKYTAPSITFTAKSATLLAGSLDKQTVTLKVSPTPFDDSEKYPVTFVSVEQLVGKSYQVLEEDSNLLVADLEGNQLILRAPGTPSDKKAHTYRVTLACAGKQFYYTVKTLAPATKVGMTLSQTGGIHSKLTNSYVKVTVKLKNFHAGSGEKYMLLGIEERKGRTVTDYLADNLFDWATEGNTFTFSLNGTADLKAKHTYTAIIGVDTDGDGEWNVKNSVTLKTTVSAYYPTLSLSAKGTVDVTRPDTAITLTPYFSGIGYTADTCDILFYKKSGKKYIAVEEADEVPFDVSYEEGKIILTAGEDLTAATNVWYAAVTMSFSDRYGEVKTLKSKMTALTVKQNKVTVKSSASAVTLYSNDRFSRGTVTLSIADKTVAPIESVELDSVSAKRFQLVSRYDGAEELGDGVYGIEFLGNLRPTNTKTTTAKLYVYVEGCSKPVATVSVKIGINTVLKVSSDTDDGDDGSYSDIYTVKQGDTLRKIAAAYGTTWEEIYNLNKKTIGSDPNKIYAGQKLKIPD